jgi:hypothetical protein
MIYRWATCTNPDCGKTFLKVRALIRYCSDTCRLRFYLGPSKPIASKNQKIDSELTSSNTRSGGNRPNLSSLASQVMSNQTLRAKQSCVKTCSQIEVYPSDSDVEVVETMGLSFAYPDLSGQSHSTRTRFPRNYPQDGGK